MSQHLLQHQTQIYTKPQQSIRCTAEELSVLEIWHYTWTVSLQRGKKKKCLVVQVEVQRTLNIKEPVGKRNSLSDTSKGLVIKWLQWLHIKSPSDSGKHNKRVALPAENLISACMVQSRCALRTDVNLNCSGGVERDWERWRERHVKGCLNSNFSSFRWTTLDVTDREFHNKLHFCSSSGLCTWVMAYMAAATVSNAECH